MTLVWLTLLPFAVAGILPLLGRALRDRSGWVAVVTAGSLLGYFATWLPAVASGHVARGELVWAPALGVSLSVYLDGLSLFFALLVTGVGTLIFTYGRFYLGREEDHPRFFASMLLFMGPCWARSSLPT